MAVALEERGTHPRRPRVSLGWAARSVGFWLVAAWVLVAVLAPVIAPFHPNQPSADLLAPPSWHHLFGTDEVGRDVFSRVIYGARTSFPTAIAAVAAALAAGGVLGAFAGYLGGAVDVVTMRVVELVFAFPAIILAMAIAAAVGPGLLNAAIAIVAVSWPYYARIVRGTVLSVMHEDYVMTSRLLGMSGARTLRVDVAPNVAGPVVVLCTLELGNAILLLASLSFLGLGVTPPTPEWGSMVSEGALNFQQWWVATFPGIAIASAVIGLNLIGDRLRDRLDPRAADPEMRK